MKPKTVFMFACVQAILALVQIAVILYLLS